ncbi:ATP-binding protein [Saccharicrinis sp. FJH2]|uniref:sensor histidine kinase n=1 Tax=Saccharicrinis sp. FJH65 TaxID=3344659 RepID=UPI0035F222E3
MSQERSQTDLKKPGVFSRLFWQLSAIFLFVLVLFAAIVLYISVQAARSYSEEVNQKLNRELASNMLGVIQPLVAKDSLNKAALGDIMHSMMVINPSVEVYILNPDGKILSYVAPDKVVKLENVSLDPIQKFLTDNSKGIVMGDDPRNPGESKIFSATRIIEDNKLIGYIYIVLASQEYASASHTVLGSYILGISIRSMIVILLIAAMTGLIAFWFLTKKLNNITKGILAFRSGHYDARIDVQDKSELDRIGLVFNEMADTIEKNIEELKGVDNLRKELISNVSHDLRTPVASIQGYAETLLLKQGKLKKEDEKKYLETIVKSSERLKKLVFELFELSKLETNQIKPDFEPLVIGELVSDIAAKFRILSQKKGVSINTILSKDLPMVEADISLLERALQNLIDNAIKFCNDGDTINIEVNMKDVEKVQVRISDSGQGIKNEDIPHIFDRYYKSHEYADSTGLGLAIVKKIMELHHSDIKVVSQYGKGTTFSFNLPVAQIA